MNRVEAAARRRVPDNDGGLGLLTMTAAETPTGQPVAGTPGVFFAAFGAAYLVARAIGPADSPAAAAAYTQLIGEDTGAGELLALRQAAVAG